MLHDSKVHERGKHNNQQYDMKLGIKVLYVSIKMKTLCYETTNIQWVLVCDMIKNVFLLAGICSANICLY